MTRRIASRVGLFAFSMVLMLVATECAVRILGIPHPRMDILDTCDRPLQYYETPPEIAHPDTATNAALRIAVIGDSFTRGVGVQWDDRYASRLERMLNLTRRAPLAEVRVFARSGTSTFQQEGLLRAALDWHPQIVVLGICLNDAENFANPRQLWAWRSEMEPQMPEGITARLVSHSRLVALAYRRLQLRRAGKGYLAYYHRLYAPTYSGWVRFREAIDVFQQACADENVRFLPVVFPLLSHPFEKGVYPFEFAHEAIAGCMREHGIEHLDLLETVRHFAPDRLSVIPCVDPHPNEIMHRIMAEAIHAELLKRQWIAPEYRVFAPDHQSKLLRIWQQRDDVIQMKALFEPPPPAP